MNKNVPKLRFKEFNDKWRATKLGEVIDYKKGFAFKSKDYTDNGVRVIKISDTTASSISEEGNTFVKFEMFEEFKEWVLKTEDIIISTVGSRPPLYSSMVGKVVKIPEFCNGSLLNQNLVKLVPKDIINMFLYSLLKKTRYTKHIENICRGNANQVSITLEELFDFKVNIPSLQEQEKIADFFTILDSLIEEQDGKVSDLELYKKGMMQKIFSQEIRFKDENGCDYSKWKEQALSNYLTESKIIGSEGSKAKKLTVKLWGKGIVAKKELYEGSDNTKYYIRKAGQLMYGKLDFLNCAFGIVPDELDGYESTVDAPAFDIKGIEPYFLLSKIVQKHFYKKYGDIADGSRKAKRIHTDTFLSMSINIPTIAEQKKIVKFLSSIDNLIEEEKKKLEDLREMKKGLLQQMFI